MAITLPKSNPIDYLVHRKYPSPLYLKSAVGNSDSEALDSQAWKENTEAYRAELESKSSAEIMILYSAEKAKEQEEEKFRKELEEKRRFYNQPDATADFDYWSKAPYWSLDEALALSFSKDPSIVSWRKLENMTQISAFAKQYEKTRNLAQRAELMKHLTDPVLPGMFIDWARKLDVIFPDELEQLVLARSKYATDWKSRYEELEGHFNKQKQLLQDVTAHLQQATEMLKKRPSATEKPLKTRERDTFYKLVIGMAVAGYKYDPKAKRQDAISDIAGDLERLGISLSDDTIRKWLSDAAQLLPPEAAEILER